MTESANDVDLDDPRYYFNRELSELAFQRRVLHEAEDERTPLLERVRFLSIATQNLDEFFRKRVGGLKQQVAADVTERTPDGRTPREQWDAVLDAARPLFERQAACYRELRAALAAEGIEILDYDDLDARERDGLRVYFESSVMPTLTPLTFDPAHPFPFISNLSLSLAVLTRESPDAEPTFSRVKVPKNRPRLVQIGDDDRYVLLEDVIESNLETLFPGVDILDTSTFRVTRNAEVGRDGEVAEDLVNRIQEVLRERQFASVVRLEIQRDAPPAVRELLIEHLELQESEVYDLPGPLDYREFVSLVELDRPELSVEPWTPREHPRLPDSPDCDVFAEIAEGDVLVHHPYHSFTTTVQRFFEAAATDPDVLAIKASIYRTARDSTVIEALIEAARNGKQVAVMVELKARFDEENNLRWVERLEEEGIHVAYGTIGYKAHTKTSLVVREEGDDVRLYSHVGTGNYHSETAKQYEDLGLLTADRGVGHDLVKLFNYFTGHALHEEFRTLMIAPINMRSRLLALLRGERAHARAGHDARIVLKVNRLEDPELVRELYRASMAGVDVDLIVRDICRLRPEVDGVSENITVRSVVGRFLEHSRVLWLHDGGEPTFYLGSADWMTRNLDQRVEALAPVTDPGLREYLRAFLETMLADNRRAWTLAQDGTYEQRRPDGDETIDVQYRLMALAADRTPRTPTDQRAPGSLNGGSSSSAETADTETGAGTTVAETRSVTDGRDREPTDATACSDAATGGDGSTDAATGGDGSTDGDDRTHDSSGNGTAQRDDGERPETGG